MNKRPSFEGFDDPQTTNTHQDIQLSPQEREHKKIAIRSANDVFRRTLTGGDIFTTSGVASLGLEANLELMEMVRTFTDFHPNNDPYGEHDFGSFEFNCQKFYWKIDYYDHELREGSPDPANPACTRRVLTIMLAEEY
ncbi:MAG: DUF3768 domain-containing protein [Verrucomicrobiota bacterium]